MKKIVLAILVTPLLLLLLFLFLPIILLIVLFAVFSGRRNFIRTRGIFEQATRKRKDTDASSNEEVIDIEYEVVDDNPKEKHDSSAENNRVLPQ